MSSANDVRDDARKFAVIGAGPAGLTALKNLLQLGIPAVAFEREDDVGGNWYFGRPCSSTCHSTHLISSKRMTEYRDFPMPRGFAPYPSHKQALQYLRDYARHFELYPKIEFQAAVERVERLDNSWQVTVAGQAPRWFRGIVIANGHHWDPLWPTWPGQFSGQLLHAKQYKVPEQIRGRRVLVVGAGNSGCDLAVEAALHAETAYLSVRRGYHFLPKFLFGRPIDSGGDRLRRWHWPMGIVRGLTKLLVDIALGAPETYGLPRPDHRLFASHPIVNSQLLYHVGHGDIRVKPDVQELAGDRVRFVDGSEVEVDTILCATGYRVRFPFLAEDLARELIDAEGRPRLYLNVFHPAWDDLFVVGLIQPNSGLWCLADDQARLMAAFIAAQNSDPTAVAWFRREKAKPNPDLSGGQPYVDSPRHHLEIDYFTYQRRLQALRRRFKTAP